MRWIQFIYLIQTIISLSLSFSLTVSINVDEFYDLLTISVQLYSLLKIRRRLEEKNKLNWDKSSSTLMEMGITLSLSLFLSLSLSLSLSPFFSFDVSHRLYHTLISQGTNESLTFLFLFSARVRSDSLPKTTNPERKWSEWMKRWMGLLMNEFTTTLLLFA